MAAATSGSSDATSRYYRNQQNERYYCALCNVWMASDRQSILVHENGRKHREKVEEASKAKRRAQQQQEQQNSMIQKSLQQMETSARTTLVEQDLMRHAVDFLGNGPAMPASTASTTVVSSAQQAASSAGNKSAKKQKVLGVTRA